MKDVSWLWLLYVCIPMALLSLYGYFMGIVAWKSEAPEENKSKARLYFYICMFLLGLHLLMCNWLVANGYNF